MNLIIIDDDPFVTGALKILLEANPNITVLASGSNGKEAVSLYRRHRPDILLMDIRMEEMDGLLLNRFYRNIRMPKSCC